MSTPHHSWRMLRVLAMLESLRTSGASLSRRSPFRYVSRAVVANAHALGPVAMIGSTVEVGLVAAIAIEGDAVARSIAMSAKPELMIALFG